MDGANSGRLFSQAADRGVNTTSQLLHFQAIAEYRVFKPTVGHVPCKFFFEMCV
jgi:hypothetical protein